MILKGLKMACIHLIDIYGHCLIIESLPLFVDVMS
jgi:hypothetical protein